MFAYTATEDLRKLLAIVLGELIGLILVGVSVEALSKIYQKVVRYPGMSASLSLYRDDFTLMTRWPFAEQRI